jgi:hypothetical protein
MIFSVDKNFTDVEQIDAGSFVSLEVWERTHIQEWVRRNPQILGEQLLIVSMEFDKFVNSQDRIDLLALDRDGNLVVIELKRDPLAGFADLQALRYAAMISSMTIEKLAPYYVAYAKRYEERDISAVDAVSEMETFVDNDDFVDLSSAPRIILCSENFSREITTTVLWLRSLKVDMSCVQITPYSHKGNIVIVPKVLIPIAEAKQYLIDIKTKEASVEQAVEARKPKAMQVILENGLLKAGDRIYLKNALPSWLAFSEGDSRFQASITGKTGQSNAVKWDQDDEEYSISNLTWNIFTGSHPANKPYGGLSGAWHWVDEKGRPLSQIAEEFSAKP